MNRYRSRPQEVEAIQWTGDNQDDVHRFANADARSRIMFSGDEHGWDLHLLAGKDGAQDWVPVPVGYWIVRPVGDLSDHWPVEPDYFAAKYEPVETDPALPAPPRAPCTGVTARWCHNCGDCSCPEGHDLEWPPCPLHGTSSVHAEASS